MLLLGGEEPGLEQPDDGLGPGLVLDAGLEPVEGRLRLGGVALQEEQREQVLARGQEVAAARGLLEQLLVGQLGLRRVAQALVEVRLEEEGVLHDEGALVLDRARVLQPERGLEVARAEHGGARRELVGRVAVGDRLHRAPATFLRAPPPA